MARLNHVNIKLEEDDEQKEVSINNLQQNNEGHDASSCQLSVRAPKHVKKEEEGEDGIVKQVQTCTKVKIEEEGRECFKFELDGDECDCEECRIERQIKVEFNQNNAIKYSLQQGNRSPGPSSETEKGVPSQSSVWKRVKKEEEDSKLIGRWDEDCDCDECRRMRLKAIRLKQNNDMENREAFGDDGEDTEIDEDGDGNEDFLVGNDGNKAMDDQIGDEDGDDKVSSENQMSDADDETEIDDEEYEMESGGEESQTVEDARIDITLPHRNGQTRKIVRQSVRHLKRKQTDDDISTECTTTPIHPNLGQSNRQFQCSFCTKSFDRNFHLQQHLRAHTGEQPFQCDQCDKRFNQQSNLTTHQRIHQNIKNFQCAECDKQFTQKNSLDFHLLTHSGERPFKCRHCAKSFTTSDSRNRHEQSIHLHVQSYRCKHCARTTTERSAIIKHIRVVHFGLPRTIKQQRALNIIDHRDARELIEKV